MEFSREEKTPTPRTMNEIEWDDTEHRFAGAVTEDGRELVMLERRWVEGLPDLYVIMCVDLEGSTGLWTPGQITPTGRRFRLEPTGSVPIEPVFDPAHSYRDRVGNEWSYVIRGWRCYSTATGKLLASHFTPPAEYGPYTRIEQEDEQKFDPAYTYSDRQGDEWECLDGWWFIGATHAERVAGRKVRPGRASPPEAFGPYTRIEEEEANE